MVEITELEYLSKMYNTLYNYKGLLYTYVYISCASNFDFDKLIAVFPLTEIYNGYYEGVNKNFDNLRDEFMSIYTQSETTGSDLYRRGVKPYIRIDGVNRVTVVGCDSREIKSTDQLLITSGRMITYINNYN